MFYVYEHWRTDTNTCFYVGQGKKHRPNSISRNSRNKKYAEIWDYLKNNGYSIEIRIIGEDMTYEDSIKLEIERVAFYGKENLSNGNHGGKGQQGNKLSDEVVKKLSESKKGRKYSMEHKNAISAGMTRSNEISMAANLGG